jgi:hypothetical protein
MATNMSIQCNKQAKIKKKKKSTVRFAFNHFVRLVCYCVSFMASGQTTQPLQNKRGLCACRCCRRWWPLVGTWRSDGLVADKGFSQLQPPFLLLFFLLSLSRLFSQLCLTPYLCTFNSTTFDSFYDSFYDTLRVVWARHLLSQLEVELDGLGRPSRPPSPTRTNHLRSWTKSRRTNCYVPGRPSVPTGSDCSHRNLTKQPPFDDSNFFTNQNPYNQETLNSR